MKSSSKAVVVFVALVLGLQVPALATSRDPGLPNPQVTPGAINPAVNQTNIYSTI